MRAAKNQQSYEENNRLNHLCLHTYIPVSRVSEPQPQVDRYFGVVLTNSKLRSWTEP